MARPPLGVDMPVPHAFMGVMVQSHLASNHETASGALMISRLGTTASFMYNIVQRPAVILSAYRHDPPDHWLQLQGDIGSQLPQDWCLYLLTNASVNHDIAAGCSCTVDRQ